MIAYIILFGNVHWIFQIGNFVLNGLTVFFWIYSSKIFTYIPTGKYKFIGHSEGVLENGAVFSIYYPCESEGCSPIPMASSSSVDKQGIPYV